MPPMTIETNAPQPTSPTRSAWKPFLAGGCLGIVLGAVLLMGAFLIAYNFFYTQSVTKMAEAKDLQPVRIRADFNWSLAGADGATLDLHTLQGRPIFLHLWRPECVSCLAEIPGLNALFREFEGKGIAFVSVSLDADPAAALADHDVHFPVYTAGAGGIPAPFHTLSTPTTYIIDSAGFIVFRHTGAQDWDSPDARDFLAHLAR